jgi:hypothetical protein
VKDPAQRTRQRLDENRRLLGLVTKLLLAPILVLLVVAVALQFGWVRQATGIDTQLKGSIPPSGRVLADLSTIDGVSPPIPSPSSDKNRPLLFVATCADCRSGDVIGGFLRRFVLERPPANARIRVVVWSDKGTSFASTHKLPAKPWLTVHTVKPEAQEAVQSQMKIGDSGMSFVVGPSGRGGSTFSIGFLKVEDVRHDLKMAP